MEIQRVFGISRGVGGAVIPHQVRDRFPNGVRNLVRWGTRPFALLRVTMQWEILILTTVIPREPIQIYSLSQYFNHLLQICRVDSDYIIIYIVAQVGKRFKIGLFSNLY